MLALTRELGDQRGEAHTLDSIGYSYHHLGRHHEAVTCYEQAAAVARELGDSYTEAAALSHLADTLFAAGDAAAARDAWQQALDILDRLGLRFGATRGYSDVDELRAKLKNLEAGGKDPSSGHVISSE